MGSGSLPSKPGVEPGLPEAATVPGLSWERWDYAGRHHAGPRPQQSDLPGIYSEGSELHPVI